MRKINKIKKLFKYDTLSKVGARIYTDSKGVCKLPDRVTKIGEEVFKNRKDIKEVCGDKVINVGKRAFEGCKNLTKIKFPNLTEIEKGTFKDCENLEEVDLKKVNTIGNFGFYNTKISKIDFPELIKIGIGAFSESKVKTIHLPKVVTIRERAFEKCTNLEGIFTSEERYDYVNKYVQKCFNEFSVRKIEVTYRCGKRIYTPESLNVYRESIANLTLDKADKFIEKNGICKLLKEATKGNVNQFINIILPIDVIEIGNNAFKGNERIKKIIGNGVTKINNNAFEDCTNLKSITFRNLEEIGDEAFKGCSELEEIKILGVIKNLGKNIFIGCSKLKNVYILNYEEYIKMKEYIENNLKYKNDINFFCKRDYDFDFNNEYKISTKGLSMIMRIIKQAGK